MSRGALRQLLACELLRLWRAPAFSVPTLGFPAVFFWMFGPSQHLQRIDGVAASQYLIVSYSAFAVMSVGMFAFGVAIASEREFGWNKLLRITPLSPLLHLSSRLIVAAVFSAASMAVLVAFAALTVPESIDAGLILGLATRVLPGIVTFSALGIAVGYLCPAHAATAVANVLFLPLAFASGLFVPLEYLPRGLQSIARYLPSYHLAAMGRSQFEGSRSQDLLPSTLAMIGFTAGFALLAWWAYRREEMREYR